MIVISHAGIYVGREFKTVKSKKVKLLSDAGKNETTDLVGIVLSGYLADLERVPLILNLNLRLFP